MSILLSLEVLSNNGFAFTLLVLVYFGWMHMRQKATGEGGRVTLKKVMAFKRETALIWWGILPLIVLVLQLGFFAVALWRGELVGLLAWSFGHRRLMSFTPATLGVFGSAFGFGLILVALAHFSETSRPSSALMCGVFWSGGPSCWAFPFWGFSLPSRFTSSPRVELRCFSSRPTFWCGACAHTVGGRGGAPSL